MRWIALWLLLTAVYVLGWAVAHWAAGGSLTPGAEALVLFAVVPPVQVLALWVVATVRHAREESRTAGTARTTKTKP